MKKLALILACLLALTLCACGGNQTGDDTTAPETTQAPATTAPETDPPETTQAPEATDPEETTAPAADAKELAMSCIEKSVDELYALIGEPESSDYAASCMGPGEDGNLYYDGFTVYTYKEGDSETVQFVE